jgi:6-phosphogluconolactonase (cycloisomerase 2 family)
VDDAIAYMIAGHRLGRRAFLRGAVLVLLLSHVIPALAVAGPSFAYVPHRIAGTVGWYRVEATGQLTAMGSVATGGRGTVLVLAHPLLPLLYAINGDSFDISILQRDPATGALRLLTVVKGQADPLGGLVHRDGRSLYVTIHQAGSSPSTTFNGLLRYAIDAQGMLTLVGAMGGGTAPAAVVADRTFHFLYTPNTFSHTVSGFQIDPTSGKLLALIDTAATGQAPDAAVTHPQAPLLYTANRGSRNLSIFRINEATGRLTLIGTAPAGDAPAALALHPGGGLLYAVNAVANTLMAYRIEPNGLLTLLKTTMTGVSPADVTVGPNGRALYVANQRDNTVGSYQLDATGLPSLMHTVASGSGPVGVTIVTSP